VGRRVGVVGAGLAGLRAARALQAGGARVVVVEKLDQPGGKAALEVRDGFSLDRSLQVVSHEDTSLLAWISELGIAGELLPLRAIHQAQLHGGRIVAGTPGVRPWHRLHLLRLSRLMRRYASVLDPACPERAAELDYRSVADFGRLYFGRTILERLITPRATADFLGAEDELSRVAFLLQWRQSSWGTAGLGLAAAGLGRIATAAADGLDLRTGLRADQIKEQGGGVVTLECSGTSKEVADESFELDALVLAVPAREAGRIAAGLVTPAERDFFAGVRTGPLVTLSIASDRPPTGLPQLVRVPHAEHRSIEAILFEPGIPGGRAPDGAGLVTLAATQQFAERYAEETDEWVQRALLAALDPIHPALSRSLRFAKLHRDPLGIPRFEVGAYRELARFRHVQRDRRSLGRRLYFAGDYLAGPRFEDAVASGARAAVDLAADMAVAGSVR
jgi:oxygen-dependent protoporphyrinogen oxidase